MTALRRSRCPQHLHVLLTGLALYIRTVRALPFLPAWRSFSTPTTKIVTFKAELQPHALSVCQDCCAALSVPRTHTFRCSGIFTQVSLGYYEKELDAARAYDAESLRLRGPSGHVNLPESRQMVQARPQAAEAPRDSPAGQPSGAS